MQYDRDDAGYNTIATLDIETTHWKATEGETVSVGVAVHNRNADELTYEPFHRESGDDEPEMIERALEFVDDCGADALVSYNGKDFDMGFLHDRLQYTGHDPFTPDLDTPETHIDLLEDRKAVCERTGQKWPKLEECLETYGFPEPVTEWDGQPVTNKRFGEELGPAYLEAVSMAKSDRAEQLREVIDHYLVTDLEANLAIYYSDCGAEFEPEYLGMRRSF